MANVATIHWELPRLEPGTKAYISSAGVDLAGFQWSVGGHMNGDSIDFRVEDTRIKCMPKRNWLWNTIWNCEVFGKFVAFTTDSDVHCAKLWSHSFNFHYHRSKACVLLFSELAPAGTTFLFGKEENKAFYKVDLQINVVSFKLIELSVPFNQMIESGADAAELIVGDQKFWVSKPLLGCHSPFFKTLFKSVTEQYELTEINRCEFLHFLSLLYGVHVETDDSTIEYLVKLGVYFQCDVVISHCRSVLFHSAIPIRKKLKLVDQLGLHSMARKLLLEMDYASLDKIMNSGDLVEFSGMMNSQIMTRMKELRCSFA